MQSSSRAWLSGLQPRKGHLLELPASALPSIIQRGLMEIGYAKVCTGTKAGFICITSMVPECFLAWKPRAPCKLAKVSNCLNAACFIGAALWSSRDSR
jgi:hypothetical protein